MKLFLRIILVIMAIPMYGKTFNLQSPNKRLQVDIVSGEALTWSIILLLHAKRTAIGMWQDKPIGTSV